MAEIYGNTTTTPINPNLFSGGSGGGIIDQTYNPESENAQSGVAVTEALKTIKLESVYSFVPTVFEQHNGLYDYTNFYLVNNIAENVHTSDDDVRTVVTVLTNGTNTPIYCEPSEVENISVGDTLFIQTDELNYKEGSAIFVIKKSSDVVTVDFLKEFVSSSIGEALEGDY